MIHLSWSVLMLAGYLVAGVLLVAWFWKKNKVTAKQASICLSCYAAVIGFLAFDVGTRQQDLQRSSFDAQAPEAQGKVIRETMDRAEVKQYFEESVKDSK